MNILFLTREYKNEKLPKVGGTGVFYAQLAKELVKRGHNVQVFGVNKANATFDDEGVKVHFMNSLFKRNPIVNLLRSVTGKAKFLEGLHFKIHEYEKKDIAKKLYQFIEKNNLTIDIIETHDFEGLSLYLDNSIKYAVRCHGSYSVLANYFGYKKAKGRMHCERKAITKAENIISISKFNEFANRELFGDLKFNLIYNGTNTDVFKNTNEEVIRNSIFYFGNVTMEKGADVAIHSFVKINKEKPETTLHFVGGESDYKKTIQEIATKNKLTAKVHFHGYQTSSSIIPLLSKAHVVMLPSKGENFSLGILEMMSLNKPIICADIPAFKEVIQDNFNGLIASTEDDFAKKILMLLDRDDLALHLGTNARNTVVEDFSFQTMIQKTEAYYSEILK